MLDEESTTYGHIRNTVYQNFSWETFVLQKHLIEIRDSHFLFQSLKIFNDHVMISFLYWNENLPLLL